MILEGVIVCVNYADFLAETLPRNRQHFDHLVVVTTPEDEETQKLCEWHHVHCVVSPRITQGGVFRKGAGINDGLAVLSKHGWVIQMDADIALPPETRNILEQIHLDPSVLYGTDRFNVNGYKAWHKFCRRPKLQHEANVYVHLNNGFPMATRFVSPDYQGYVPIGFFQLWNPGVTGVMTYPEQHTNAGRSDMVFAGQWTRAERHSLPEIVCYHLESDSNAPQGANWEGRTTPPFEPTNPIVRWWRRHRRHRHRHHHHPYFLATPYQGDTVY